MLSTVTASEPAEPAPARDPHRPARLLQAERDALLPILHRTPDRAFDRPTACPGWSVRDVLAHCAAALSRVAAGNLHAFTPALNELDVAKRREWPLSDRLAELSVGYQEAGKAITDAGGKLDVIALHDALDQLMTLNQRQGLVVSLRFFAGLSVPEVADVLEVSAGTVERDWRIARAWLRGQLGGAAP